MNDATYNGSVYTLTEHDGTVATFSTAYGTTSQQVYNTGPVLAQATTIVKPSGETLTYTYDTITFTGVTGTQQTFSRIQSVTNNFGYMMKYTYQDNGNDSSASLVTGVTAINNAVDYCAPSVNTCSNLTYSWPAITIVGQLEFTDPLGRTTDYPQPQTSAQAVYQLPSGLQSVLQYDVSGRVTGVTTPTGTWGLRVFWDKN